MPRIFFPIPPSILPAIFLSVYSSIPSLSFMSFLSSICSPNLLLIMPPWYPIVAFSVSFSEVFKFQVSKIGWILALGIYSFYGPVICSSM
ncbi:hypothetical protein BZA77DRAFT_310170 [Pyronema omphalodes]|nr:hypothetical protein BZA77DRAFT_310170 [Pyronema omphalodes]